MNISLFLLTILGVWSSSSSSLFVTVVNASNEAGIDFLTENKNKDGIITLDSGLQYKVLNKGNGSYHPTIDSSCSCHYEGKLLDGTVFDSSYERNSPTSFAPNQVIKGWTEAMQLMVVGDKWEMYIPSELGYGDRGSPPKIGGGDVLVFIMEILSIDGDKILALTCNIDTINNSDDSESESALCTERELEYIQKMNLSLGDDNDMETIKKNLKRIESILKDGKMNDSLRDWASRRRDILTQYLLKAVTKMADEL